MPILKMKSIFIILLTLLLTSCDPPEYLENKLTKGYSSNNENEVFPPKEKPLNEVSLREKIERFYQNKRDKEKIDLIWVIDNSGSMEDEQNDLARNFDLFIDEFIIKDIDFRMAITTTDIYDQGKAVKSIYGLRTKDVLNNEADFVEDFNKRVRVGIRGHGKEQGLQGSINFLRRYSYSFLRDDAFLIIIYVSDEEDQSIFSANDAFNELKKFKRKTELIKVYSIVNKKNNKISYYESIGQKYCELSNKTGGLCSNIKDDFSTILSNLGKKIGNLKESFLLEKRPKSSVQVYVEGNLLVEGWDYDSQLNAVLFKDSFLPNDGEEIEIRYYF